MNKLLEMPHISGNIKASSILIDFRIELYPETSEIKRQLIREFNSKGLVGYYNKKWYKFNNSGIKPISDKLIKNFTILPEYWTTYAIVNVLNELNEIERKFVIRGRKKIRKVFCGPGKKAKNGRCVIMKSSERMKRKISSRRAKIKRHAKQAKILRNRKKSLVKRKSLGLK